MSALINIIHPDMYKTMNGAKFVGQAKEFQERDGKVKFLVEKSLEVGARVIYQRNSCHSVLDSAMEDFAFHIDPNFEFLSDKRVIDVATTRDGLPIRDERPKSILEEKWKSVKEIFTTHEQLSEFIGSPLTTFFIGGMLENCVYNSSSYYNKFYRNGEKVFYIPELCVSVDEEKRKDAERKLSEINVLPVGYDAAVGMVAKNQKINK